jgi:hypothetical protein
MTGKTTTNVVVHYIAAAKPFKTDVDPGATLGAIKVAALNEFTLAETDTKVYKMFAHKTELTNMSETVGAAAGDKHELQIDLEEFIIQGINGR